MKSSKLQFLSSLESFFVNGGILLSTAIISVVIGLSIAMPLWFMATKTPQIYSWFCFIFLVSFSLITWIRKIYYLKKKKALSFSRRAIFISLQTFSFFSFLLFLLSIIWQLPVAALICFIAFFSSRIPLFLMRDSL